MLVHFSGDTAEWRSVHVWKQPVWTVRAGGYYHQVRSNPICISTFYIIEVHFETSGQCNNGNRCEDDDPISIMVINSKE